MWLGVSLKHWLWGAAGAYLVLGLILTKVILKGTTYRLKFRDALVGSVAMPILFLLLMFFEISDETWRRILIMLAFDPPEIMRAKPLEPAKKSEDPFAGLGQNRTTK